MLYDDVREAIARYRMVECGDGVVIAVSGGADSMVLLHALHNLRDELGCRLVVAHLDHGLRPSSAGDARFVSEAAAALGLALESERVDVGQLARVRRGGLEDAAREARRTFLARVAAQHSAARIALGHTADDQAETLLYRLARGTGWAGLGAMAPVSGRLIRPLLSVTRAEVRQFASEQGIRWREDATNSDLRFARNRIRERVLPELVALNPDAARALTRTSALARDAETIARFAVDCVWPNVCLGETADCVRLSRVHLAAVPRAVQSEVVREALRRVRGDLHGLGHAHIHAVLSLVERSTEGARDLPRARVAADAEIVEVASRDASSTDWATTLPLGRTALDDVGLVVEASVGAWLGGAAPAPADAWAEVADADLIRFPLVARGRRPGDRFSPLGLGHDTRLKSFLINARVPRARRERLALICDQEKIVWIAGVRLSDAVKLGPATKRALTLRAEEVSR